MTEFADEWRSENAESAEALWPLSASTPARVPEQTANEAIAPSQGVAPQGRAVRVRSKRGPLELSFQPIKNGVDYLLSVTEHLAGTPSPRDLKYAVLHLQAAVEVLLKARLLGEHWSLVFEKPENASKENFDKGAFQSCGTTAAVKRLKNIVGLDLGMTGKVEADLKQLAEWRNALQHYGLTAPAPGVEKLAANVLDFLLTFIASNLRPALGVEERRSLNRDMESVSEGLVEIRRFLTARWNNLREELESLAERTLCCPLCKQDALVLDDELTCRFCQMVWRDGGDAAAAYVENIQGYDIYAHMRDGGDDLVAECSECYSHALVADVAMTSGERFHHLCFACGAKFVYPDSCDSCGCPVVSVDKYALCGRCEEAKFANF